MKRFTLSLVVCILLLSACKKADVTPASELADPIVTVSASPNKPSPSIRVSESDAPSSPDDTDPPTLVYPLSDYEFWRRVDGSTATIPMSYAFFEHFAGDNEYPSWVIQHNKTFEAYQNLLDGKVDLIFVTEPSVEAKKLFDDAGVEIDIVPIVKDAFVLLVNANNPVSSLTQDQLRDIYSGKITNWKDVGGEDNEIIPFQRGNTSGSQTLFLSLLMRDTEPMLAPTGYYLADMGGVIDAVAEYKNGDAAIGFSVFYYAYAMYGNDNVRFLEVDGVLPTEDSIISGKYPLESFYYAVLRKDTPIDHPTRELVSWILNDEGQSVMRKAGYVPLRELTTPFNNSELEPDYYGNYDSDSFLYGIGAELSEPLEPLRTMDVFDIPRKLDSGVYYSQPFTSLEKVNVLLESFVEDLLTQADFNARVAESIHKYGVPFRQLTLPWGNYLTCVIYFGEGSSFHLYGFVPDAYEASIFDNVSDTFEAYASICIDIEKGKVIDPDVIIDALMDLNYMKGVKTVYERADDWFSDSDHIPSEEHIITALWINSEQAVVMEIMDQGNSYRYGICTNDSGEFAGP